MKVTLYIDGKHNTVEVKDKIKSVLPDANYMIFDPTKNIDKVTNFDRIKAMSVGEMQKAIYGCLGDECHLPVMCCLAQNCKECIKQWLETEVETE